MPTARSMSLLFGMLTVGANLDVTVTPRGRPGDDSEEPTDVGSLGAR